METKNCQNCKKEFTVEKGDKDFYVRFSLPEPTFCPQCRLIRRLVWINDRYLYFVNCKLCGVKTFSMQPENSSFALYCHDCWYSDDFDPMIYARDYDFSKNFFEQWADLLKIVPTRARLIDGRMVESNYTNWVSNLKRCYLIYNSDYSEDCLYGTEIENSKNSVDNMMIDTCEECHECVNCQNCNRIFYSTDSLNSSDIWFSYNLAGCMDCFGCVNLRNKNHYIFNEPYSKTDYDKKIKEMWTGSALSCKELISKADELRQNLPRRFAHTRQVKSVAGDYIYTSKEVHEGFVVSGAQNCRYVMWLVVAPSKDCIDYTQYGDNAEQIVETSVSGINVSRIFYSSWIFKNSINIWYSHNCFNSENLFGCVGVRKKKYCILNKEYSKEEYESMVEKIKKQMDEMPYTDKNGCVYKFGEFPPIEIAPNFYNQSSAQEFFPLNEEEVVKKGYKWKPIESKINKATIASDDVPDPFSLVQDSILNETIACAQAEDKNAQDKNCTRAFRIVQNELFFYKRHNLPLPRLCPNCRHFKRALKRTMPWFYEGNCSLCGASFKTPYAPNTINKLYCEKCYQQEVI